ncbi:zinc finger protein RFP-like [Sceloporus undulatus]|uniref:zinc finger protein RFP-like n=1 Tax=Sceloporus undulatus TaxID=8520 RepID=UPI001C4CFC65|nr:zinc finger protein RFP-like [Sceloporus undulatus]
MAVSKDPFKGLSEEATCPVCLDYFKDPVIITNCGHHFCRACLLRCFRRRDAKASCPQCRTPFKRSSLLPNRQLANVVEIAKEFSGQQGEKRPRVEESVKVCEKHQKPLKLFCKADETSICEVCGLSKEHQDHEVVPVEDAFQEYKVQVWNCLQTLKKEREKILGYKAETEKESQDWLIRTEAEMGKTVAKFRELRHFLKAQESFLVAQMEDVKNEIARRREEHMTQFSKELSSLETLIWEIAEKHQQPASEFFQDIRTTLQRCEKKETFKDPVVLTTALKWQVWEFCDLNPFLDNVIKGFTGTLTSGFQLQKAKVTLDPDTAHRNLILSEDCQSVKYEDNPQVVPDSPERFDLLASILGCHGFTRGRHFWEVDVGSEDGWAVGVARKSVGRKGVITCNPMEGIWEMWKWERDYLESYAGPPIPVQALKKEPRRIRVTLNYEGGRVAFYDAETAALIFEYPPASFFGETLLPFFYAFNKAHLTLCP